MDDKPVSILFVHSSAEMYGSDRCLYELIKRIDKTKFTPVVVLPFEGKLSKSFKKMDITVYIADPWVIRKGMFHSIRFILYILRLPVCVIGLIKIIRKENISLVYSNTSVIVGSALSALLMRKPHIYHIRELYDNYPIISGFYKRFLCVTSRKMITISNAAASFVNSVCDKKVRVIYDGIDNDRFADLTQKTPGILVKWKQDGAVIISNIGRISPIKGQELFIKSAGDCVKYDNRMRFLIIGDIFAGNEQYMIYLKDMVKKEGLEDYIMFTGFRDDVDNFITGSDIIVISTIITEGLGQVVMEGMAAGKVVVAPDKGGPVELIKHDLNGILYHSGDERALSKAILNISKDKEKMTSIGEKARYKAEKYFGIRNNIAAIEQLLEQIV